MFAAQAQPFSGIIDGVSARVCVCAEIEAIFSDSVTHFLTRALVSARALPFRACASLSLFRSRKIIMN